MAFHAAIPPYAANFILFLSRRERNPVEKKKKGSKSKHAKKFSSKKPKGAMGTKKPKKGGAGRKRR